MTDLTYTLDQIDEWLASEHLTDAEFIALARTALPELAAKVRELEAELAREERWGDKQQRRANHYQGLFRDRENETACQDRAEKAEAALARVQALVDDDGWMRELTNAAEADIRAALKEPS